MAIKSKVIWHRDESADIAARQPRDSLQVGYQLQATLEYWDDADPSWTGETVTAIEAASNPLLGLAGRTVYYYNGLVIPWLFVSRKSARRDPANRRVWRCTVSYTGRGSDAMPPPVQLADIEPTVEYIADETSQVVYDDRNNKKCLTPTGNFFKDEFRKFWGAKRVRITQHEYSLDHNEMANRKHKCNENSYRGDPAYSWRIMDIQAKDVDIVLSTGLTSVVLVEYDILNAGKPGGWTDERALIDSHYLETGGDLSTKKPHYSEELKSYTSVMLNPNGTKAADQTVPQYDGWEVQDVIDFTGFMRA